MIVYKSLCEEHNDFFACRGTILQKQTSVRNLPDEKAKLKEKNHMRNKKVLFLTQAAVIAAIYVVLTIFISAFNLASGAISGTNFRSTYHFTIFYTGSDSGTGDRVSVEQSADRGSGL